MIKEKVPSSIDEPKVMKPIPGLRGVPTPRRRDSAQIQIEKSNQKKAAPPIVGSHYLPPASLGIFSSLMNFPMRALVSFKNVLVSAEFR